MSTARFSAAVVLPRLEKVERKTFPANASGARVHPGVWDGGRPCTVFIRVTLARDQATIAVLFDGQPQLIWTGPQAALSTAGPAASLPPRRPALGADYANVLVQSARLRMLPGGKAIPVRPPDPRQQATPAVAGGRMSLRTWSHLISIGKVARGVKPQP
ncbi:MAG: hypothetical protein NTU94_03470 [Planctomycetota bacterium]|nr:hypothetical protein [Planctomycetota bacterium]